MQALNKNYEDLCSPLIDTYKLAVIRQYLYLVIYKSYRRKKLFFFYKSFSALVGEWFFKGWAIYFYGEIYTSLNIGIDGLQLTGSYQ